MAALKAYVLISLSVSPTERQPNSQCPLGEVAAPPRTLFGIPCATVAPCGVQEALTQASRCYCGRLWEQGSTANPE